MKYFDCFASAFLWGLALVMAIIFFTAYSKGGEVLVQINNHGEALFESILIPIIMILGAITVVRLFWRLKDEIKQGGLK